MPEITTQLTEITENLASIRGMLAVIIALAILCFITRR